MLRVLAVSHAAVVEVNQEPFDALARAGADVTLVAPRALRTDIRGKVRLRALEGSRARLVPLDISLGGHRRALGGQRGIHLIVYRGLDAAIDRAYPDVVFVEEEPFSLAAGQAARIAARRKIPLVVHENQNLARRLPQPFRLIRRRVLRLASGFTVRNPAAADLLRAEGYRGPIAPLPHAVDPERYRGGGTPSGLPSPVIGFVGRLVPEKGIVEAIDAAAEVGASLLVVGDGPLAGAARARAAERGVAARFCGAVPHDEVPRWYAAMDVVAIPSRRTETWMEQFGRIVIEANAAGIPVVAADSGELANTVRATGGGVVVPERDRAALATALKELLGDPERRRTLGEAGWLAVRKRFTPQAVGAELHRFLREVAGP